MLNVLGKPDDVIVTMENGTELADGEILGPYTEGSNLKLKCHAVGGRPIPEVISFKKCIKNRQNRMLFPGSRYFGKKRENLIVLIWQK